MNRNPVGRRILWLALWWLWIPVLLGLLYVWATNDFIPAPNGYSWVYSIILDAKASFFMGGALLWFYLAIGFLGSMVICAADWLDDNGIDLFAKIGVVVSLIGLVVSLVMYFPNIWDNDKDAGRYYADSTVFYVKDVNNLPDSLKRLGEDAAKDTDGCDLLGAADVRGCVQTGELSEAGWDGRISSLEGATLAIRRKTDGVQRVSLDERTMTYLNARGDQTAMWSGILDGSEKERSLYGVAEWDGKSDPKVCQFTGQYALKRAFSGDRGNNLVNYITEKYPDYRWDMNDVWGYCNGDEPIVVIPLTQPVKWMDRTVDTAAGILIVQGNNGDEPKLTYKADVKQGEYPGPVYPDSLVAHQREEAKWAAGRLNMKEDRGSFGYVPSTSAVQNGNPSEYLLRDKVTGRLVFVTPLTLRSSSSGVFVAYAVTYADEVHASNLNEMSIYVLGHNDPRLVNIEDLSARADVWMSQNAGMFRANNGTLIEFTPIDGDIWRVFGEMNGRVVYQLDISASDKISPVLVSVDASGSVSAPAVDSAQPGVSQTQSVCGGNIASLDDGSLANCLRAVTNEVQSRLQTAGR